MVVCDRAYQYSDGVDVIDTKTFSHNKGMDIAGGWYRKSPCCQYAYSNPNHGRDKQHIIKGMDIAGGVFVESAMGMWGGGWLVDPP